MPFVRRSTTTPTTEELAAIEQTWIVDRTPETPLLGAGNGALLLVGEFEDGPFETPTEVYGESDLKSRFGGFGYTYGNLLYQNPSARRHLTEIWNGNGFIKLQGLKPAKLVVCRVDTSVGDVRFTLAAGMRTKAAPFALADGDQITVTTDTGAAATTAVNANAALVAGGALVGLLAGGDQIDIAIDNLPAVRVTFQLADIGAALIVARINSFMGYTCAAVNGAALDISAIQRGSGSTVTLSEPVAGVLAKIGHVAATTHPVGDNVANAAAVTAAELVTLIESVAVLAVNAKAMADPVTGKVVIYRTGSASGTVKVDDAVGTPCASLELTTGATGLVTANVGEAFQVRAGTRVRTAGGLEWVAMRTLTWPAGTVAAPNEASQDVEVRPGNDIGTQAGAGGGTVVVEVDLPTARMVEVTNPANLSAALTEAQIDAAYAAAFDATMRAESDARIANYSLSARRSDAVVRYGMENVIEASDEGNYGRKFCTGSTLGTTAVSAIAAVAAFRSDRVFYTHRGFLQTIPEIAALGAAGGVGFVDGGQITIRADGPLAYLHCVLNPEENVGQDTGLLSYLDGLEPTTEDYNRALYTAFKAAGICAPRIDNGAMVFQSEVTTSLLAGRTTQKRRAFSDYAQDSMANGLAPYSKKLATDARRAGAISALTGLLEGWLSRLDENGQRIADYTIEETTSAHPEWDGLGIFGWKIRIKMLSSMDVLVLDTEIGEGVVIVNEG